MSEPTFSKVEYEKAERLIDTDLDVSKTSFSLRDTLKLQQEEIDIVNVSFRSVKNVKRS